MVACISCDVLKGCLSGIGPKGILIVYAELAKLNYTMHVCFMNDINGPVSHDRYLNS